MDALFCGFVEHVRSIWSTERKENEIMSSTDSTESLVPTVFPIPGCIPAPSS